MKRLSVCSNSLLFRPFTSPFALFLMAVMSAALLPGQTAGKSKVSGRFAYVTVRDVSPRAGAVAVIDTRDNRVVATVPVGPGPNGMAVTSDGKRGYVVNHGTFGPMGQAISLNDTLSVLRLRPGGLRDYGYVRPPSVEATVTIGKGPIGVAITPDDREVWVTNFGQDSTLVPGAVEGNTVSVIRTRNNKVVATILVGGLPAGIAIRPDGKRAYVTSRRTNQVWVIDTATYSVVGTIPVQTAPANVAFTPDGKRAYVTNFSSASVSVIDTEKENVLPVPAGNAIPVGNVPIGISMSSDGKRAYVVNAFSNTVSVIDTAENTVQTTFDVGMGPRAVATSPDGNRAYVSNFMSNTVYAINTADNTVASTISVTGGPNWVTLVR